MKILLRENEEGKIAALSAEEGDPLTKIAEPTVWCDNDAVSTSYEHPEGIYWDSWGSARYHLDNHEIVTD